MTSVLTGGPPPPFTAATPAAAEQQHLLLQHLQPAAAIRAAATPPAAIDVSSERSKSNASDCLAGPSNVAAAPRSRFDKHYDDVRPAH